MFFLRSCPKCGGDMSEGQGEVGLDCIGVDCVQCGFCLYLERGDRLRIAKVSPQRGQVPREGNRRFVQRYSPN